MAHSANVLPICCPDGVNLASKQGRSDHLSYKDYRQLFSGFNTKSLLKDLKKTIDGVDQQRN